MPELAIGDFGVLGRVDLENLGKSLHRGRGRVRMKRAKTLSERDMLFRWNFGLLFEKQDLIGVEGIPKFRELIIGHWLAQIDPVDFRAEVWRKRFGLKRGVGVGFWCDHLDLAGVYDCVASAIL